MERRRAYKSRPVSSEETQCWSQSRSSLNELSNVYAPPATVDTIERANRLLNSWPKNDHVPAEGIAGVKSTYTKLCTTLGEVRTTAEKECKAIEDALERLGVLIALRTASESLAPDKRNKRPRGPSPSISNNGTPAPSRSVSITIPARNSVGPQSSSTLPREKQTRKDFLYKQLPLALNRKVAFHVPAKPGEQDESNWILAVVTRVASNNKYEVQDPEPQDNGAPGLKYTAGIRSIVPLPDPNVPPNHPSHLNSYPEFPARSTVMALYPDTSCFYRAEVLASPKDVQPAGRSNGPAKAQPMYKLKFEDDENQEHSIHAQWVVEFPPEDKR